MSDNPEETAYYQRIIVMIMDLGTETALKVFQNSVPGNDVAGFLSSPETEKKLFELNKTKILNNADFYTVTANNPHPEKFDITLLVRLLISLFGKLPQNLGLRMKPDHHNVSIVADLLRLRGIRNKLVHQPNARLSQEQFEWTWCKIEKLLLRISNQLEPNSSIESKLRKYKEAPLDHFANAIQTYLETFKAWKKDIEKLQQQVEDLRKAITEFHLYFKFPPEQYVRYIKLLFDGGSLVMCGIMKRELDRSNAELDICLREKREILFTLVKSKLLRDQLFQSSLFISDPKKWDISLHAIVIQALFGNEISQEETDHIRVIKEARESYADSALLSLDPDQFLSIWTDLISSLYKLSQNIDRETARHVELLIQVNKKKCQTVETADAYFDQLRSNGVCVETLPDIYKERSKELDQRLRELAEQSITLKTDHVFDLKLEIGCGDDEKKHEAEENLEKVCQAAIDDSGTPPEWHLLRLETEKLFKNIKSIPNVKITSVSRKCILLEIRCSSLNGSHLFISYVLSTKFQTCLQNIRNELCYMYTEPMDVLGNVTLESIYEVLKDPCRSRDNESVSGINIPITCPSAEGVQQVLALLSDEDTTNSLNQIADQLSLQIDETVSLKAFPLLNEFKYIFGKTDSDNSSLGSGGLSNDEEAEDRFSFLGKNFENKDHESKADVSLETDQNLSTSLDANQMLREENEKLEKNLSISKNENERLHEENKKLAKNLSISKNENERLHEENKKLAKNLSISKNENERLHEENKKLAKVIDAREKFRLTEMENENLKQNIRKMEDRHRYEKLKQIIKRKEDRDSKTKSTVLNVPVVVPDFKGTSTALDVPAVVPHRYEKLKQIIKRKENRLKFARKKFNLTERENVKLKQNITQMEDSDTKTDDSLFRSIARGAEYGGLVGTAVGFFGGAVIGGVKNLLSKR